MKILVPVKRVVDANIKVKVGPDGKLDVANLKHSMNPFDEIALEQAVQMKEKGIANEVIAVSVGDTKSQETLRTALAMGADKGVLIQTDKPFEAEPLNVAKLISAYVKQVNPDLIICGKQAVDNDSNQVGQMIAAMCEYPQATHASAAVMMKAKRKPQEVVQASALCPDLRAHVEVVGYEAPAARKVGRKVANVDELIDKLKNEAKVL